MGMFRLFRALRSSDPPRITPLIHYVQSTRASVDSAPKGRNISDSIAISFTSHLDAVDSLLESSLNSKIAVADPFVPKREATDSAPAMNGTPATASDVTALNPSTLDDDLPTPDASVLSVSVEADVQTSMQPCLAEPSRTIPVEYSDACYDMRSLDPLFLRSMTSARLVSYKGKDYVANTFGPPASDAMLNYRSNGLENLADTNAEYVYDYLLSWQSTPGLTQFAEDLDRLVTEVVWKKWYKFERGATLNQLLQVRELVEKHPEIVDQVREKGWLYSSALQVPERMRTVFPDSKRRVYAHSWADMFRGGLEYWT
ncbi:putative mitochondrial protein [Andalucia godoyi]|uniref:Putative mitochondrial protein n=1 Tax=Andalucia godoyi TaxID=505711 RepID=A0A8K0AK39_ANDGO|nr:putative mitochondrial protein [Andalucia godoyi]|eukprot:ANDGO_04844.mRNA.1 putative mitochondrial protein